MNIKCYKLKYLRENDIYNLNQVIEEYLSRRTTSISVKQPGNFSEENYEKYQQAVSNAKNKEFVKFLFLREIDYYIPEFTQHIANIINIRNAVMKERDNVEMPEMKLSLYHIVWELYEQAFNKQYIDVLDSDDYVSFLCVNYDVPSGLEWRFRRAIASDSVQEDIDNFNNAVKEYKEKQKQTQEVSQ